MKKIMTVYDIFEIPNRGLVIGGVNSDLDAVSYEQIKKLIGTFIEIHQCNDSILKTQVIDVDTSTSLAGKTNIFLLLPEEIKKKALQKESVVYRKREKEIMS